MDTNVARRERLTRFIDLARIYRGWTRNELASRLGRDISKVIPESGNPKLDLVVALADALEWGIGDVALCVWEQPPPAGFEGASFGALEARAGEAAQARDWRGVVALERGLLATARGGDRARALDLVAQGYRGLGRHARAIECLREALESCPAADPVARSMKVRLAWSHLALWNVVEARAVAHGVVEGHGAPGAQDRSARAALAMALACRGHAACRSLPAGGTGHAEESAADLRRAVPLLEALAREFDDEACAGAAHACRGAVLEVDCARGILDPRDALDAIIDSLDAVEDPDALAAGPWLEACGWWCVHGCNVARRHLPARQLQRPMAILTNKALEIADRLDDWSLRERAFSLEQERRARAAPPGGEAEAWLLDDEDLRLVVGTMGRFPTFREHGWRILAAARPLAGT